MLGWCLRGLKVGHFSLCSISPLAIRSGISTASHGPSCKAESTKGVNTTHMESPLPPTPALATATHPQGHEMSQPKLGHVPGPQGLEVVS